MHSMLLQLELMKSSVCGSLALGIVWYDVYQSTTSVSKGDTVIKWNYKQCDTPIAGGDTPALL